MWRAIADQLHPAIAIELNILIVTYNWPPRNAMGTHRPYSWAKSWQAFDCAVTVLTSEKYTFDEPLDLELDRIPGVTVEQVPYLNSAMQRLGLETQHDGRTRLIKKLIACFKRIKVFFARTIGLSIDARGRWAKPAFRRACEIVESDCIDVVVSSYGPRASHRIAARIKKKYPNVRWVADFRDLWSGNPTLGGILVPWVRQSERNECAAADAITTVSAGFAAELSDLHSKDVVVVRNGFDTPLSLIKELLDKRNTAVSRSEKPVNIVYTGNYYHKLQDPKPIFRAVRDLMESGSLGVDGLRIHFYGARSHGLSALVEDCGAEGFVTIHGAVSRAEAVELQRNASALLLLEVLETKSGGVLPGKVFEYMASGAPIICVGDGHDIELSDIIHETGVGISVGKNEESLAAAIGELSLSTWPSWFSPRLDNISTYSRNESAEKMYRTLADN